MRFLSLAELDEKQAGNISSPLETRDSVEVMTAANGLHRAVKKLINDANTKPSNGSSNTGSSGPSVTSPGLQPDGSGINTKMAADYSDERSRFPSGYGSLNTLFEWDANASGFSAFPMEVSHAGQTGLNSQTPINFDNVELENMLASFMPSRAPSPSPTNAPSGPGPDFTNRLNEYNDDPAHAVWPNLERNLEVNNYGYPYNGWMG